MKTGSRLLTSALPRPGGASGTWNGSRAPLYMHDPLWHEVAIPLICGRISPWTRPPCCHSERSEAKNLALDFSAMIDDQWVSVHDRLGRSQWDSEKR